MKRSPADRLYLFLCMVGLCILSWIAGVAAEHYGWHPARFVASAIEGGKAWRSIHSPANPNPSANITDDNALWSKCPVSDLVTPEGMLKATVSGDRTLSDGGYTLFSLRCSTDIYLINMDGRVLHSWSIPFSTAWPQPKHIHPEVNARVFAETAYAYPNGDLLVQYTGLGDTPYGYGIVKIDKDSKVLWTYGKNAHHDFHVVQDGTIYALTHRIISEPIKGLEHFNYPLVADAITLLSPEGKELDNIPIIEAFRDSPFANMLKQEERAKAWDTTHTNSIMVLEAPMAAAFPMFKTGDILITLRNLNSIAVIDHDTRKVKWVNKGIGSWPHAARFLPNGEIAVYDNFGEQDEKRTRIIRFDPQKREKTWIFKGPPDKIFFSTGYGRIQLLANGNLLSVDPTQGYMFEVTPDKKVAWLLSLNKVPASIMTVRRYEKSALPFVKEPKP